MTTGSQQVRVGEPFTIDLPTRETAGYEWHATSSPGDVELVSRERLPTGDVPGAPGTDRFVFRALRTGCHLIRLEQRRAWEAVVAEVREVRVEAR